MVFIVVIFCALIAVFLFILGQFFVPVVRDFFKGSFLFWVTGEKQLGEPVEIFKGEKGKIVLNPDFETIFLKC